MLGHAGRAANRINLLKIVQQTTLNGRTAVHNSYTYLRGVFSKKADEMRGRVVVSMSTGGGWRGKLGRRSHKQTNFCATTVEREAVVSTALLDHEEAEKIQKVSKN